MAMTRDPESKGESDLSPRMQVALHSDDKQATGVATPSLFTMSVEPKVRLQGYGYSP